MSEIYQFKVVERPGTEKVITEFDIRRLLAEELANKLMDVTKKINSIGEFDPVSKYNPNDHFRIRDFIKIVLESEREVVGAPNFSLEIFVDGIFVELEANYRAAISKAIAESNLGQDQLYSIQDWQHECDIFDQSNEVIDENTKLKSFSQSQFVSKGKSQK